jgi:hypothetical protein
MEAAVSTDSELAPALDDGASAVGRSSQWASSAISRRGVSLATSENRSSAARRGDRELDQRQRVAGGLVQDPGALREAKFVGRRIKQRFGHRRLKRTDPALGQPGVFEQ